MFDPMSWRRFRKPLLRNRSVMAVSAVWLLSVASPLAGPADASIITTGDVDPGGAATQPDPWAVGGHLYVAYSGTGTLNVTDGGVVSNSWGFIGDYSSSTGIVTVTGTGSQWNNSNDLFVGTSGSGAINDPRMVLEVPLVGSDSQRRERARRARCPLR